MGDFYFRDGNKAALHGTYTAYCYGCRCDKCRKASSDYQKLRRRASGAKPSREADKARRELLRRLMESAEPFTESIHGVGTVEFGETTKVETPCHDLPLDA